MKTKIFFPVLITLLSFSFSLRAQNTYYLAFAGAKYYLPVASLNSQLKTMGTSTGFADAKALGVDAGYKTDGSSSSGFSGKITGLLSFHYLQKQNISSPGDSLKFTLGGYNMQFDWASFEWLGSDNFTLTGGLAWAFGRLKVTENTAQGTTTFFNKYVGPEFRLEMNIRLGGFFYAGVRYAYRYDFSKTGWTRSGINNADLTGTRLSGTMIGFFVGF